MFLLFFKVKYLKENAEIFCKTEAWKFKITKTCLYVINEVFILFYL